MSAIGLFDSGIGGLTILRALKDAFPHQDFIYLADTARLPYGTKSIATIRRYVERSLNFFSDFKLNSIVVACNSASVALLSKPVESAVPILNVIQPGARLAVEKSKNQRIGVLGTRATILSGAYEKEIKKLNSITEVISQACPLLVPLVEEGWFDDPITNLIVFRYLSQVLNQRIDTLVLGCTHYPALKDAIAKVCGPNVELVESSQALIQDLKDVIDSSTEKKGKIQIFASDYSPRLEEAIHMLLKPNIYDSLEVVDL